MAYNEELAALVRTAITGVKGVTEKKMFGGIAFMANDRMLIGVDKDDLIIRCEKEETDTLLKKKGVRVFDLSGGRPMKGWLLVGPEATNTSKGLREWIAFAVAGHTKAGKKK
jgi:TfoX/Sxy family transcriptional regulator of competence genes